MRTSTAAVARLLTGVVALVLMVIGAAALCWRWNVRFVRDRLDRIDQSWFERAPHASWWPWVLAAIAVLSIAVGVWCLVVLVRPNRIADVTAQGAPGGRITLNVADVAEAAAGELAADRRVRQAGGRALLDGRREVLRLTASVDGLTPPSELDDLLARVTAHTRRGLGTHPVHIEYLLHVDR